MPSVASLEVRLRMTAYDAGFDLPEPMAGGWLPVASSQCPLKVWLAAMDGGSFAAAFSLGPVAASLSEHGAPLEAPCPPGAAGARVVPDLPGLLRLLRRAFQLSRALPTAPLVAYQQALAEPVRTTEVERLVTQRRGQDIFRAALLDYWEGRCAVTGLAVEPLLRASHIKPWASCTSDAERLDVYNGLLLAAQLDAAFDAGLVTFDDDGLLVPSSSLPRDALAALGLDRSCRVSRLEPAHRAYLAWHREHEFRR